MSAIDPDPIIFPKFERLKALQDSILTELLPSLEGQRVIYLDAPIHLNVGDLLIEKGTYYFFEKANVKLWDRVAMLDQKRLTHLRVPSDVTLVLHGGGNFGDLYPYNQIFRLKVIEAFPDNPIIILPQSVHFNDEQAFNAQAEIINRHQNIKLYARDQYSYDFLAQSVSVERLGMLPDMALMLLGEWKSADPESDERLIFRRKDVESKMDDVENSFDWRDLVSRSDRKQYRFLKRLFKLQNRFCCNLGAHALWPNFRDKRIENAVCHYRKYGCVDTDRLHGFILSQLLGIPAICRDNSYGKIKRYIHSWP